MKTKKLLSILLTICMIVGLLPAGTITAFADDSSYSATFKYNGKTYSENEITGSKEIQLTTILAPLEITGTVTAASVSEGQGMAVTTTAITLTKAFGTGWLKVTAGGTEYEITITSTPDSISVVLYGTLFFDKNGGSGIMDGQPVQEYTQTVLPDCAFTPPDGYEFDQWEINGARYNAGATYTFGQTTTAKAIWKLREGVHSITASYNNSDGDVVVSPTMAAVGEQVTVTVQPVAGKAVDSISYSYGSTSEQALSGVEGGVYTFSMPGENTTVSVTFKEATKEPIAYVNENGNNQSCSDYRYVRSTDTSWTGWVVASHNLTLDRRVTVSGTVNLILMDGKTLTVTGGIQVGEGSTLNIYAQSGNTGKLTAGNKQNSYAAGIGGNKDSSYNAGTITVNGGQITATGGYKSAGIGGASEYYPYLGSAGNITIRGNANVVATGGEYSSGIGCGSGGIGGSITIDGNARVQARALEGYSGSGAAIGSGRGGYVNSITISGGTVIATGANMGSAIGNGNSNSGGDGGTISITGGDVTATATGSWGAGIGGLCKSITIGGNAVVHATGGNRGAGIGGFYQKAVGNITIEGNANVTATGGASGAGIGTGSEAEGEAVITITGGTVNASMSASNGAAAIGSGYKSEGKTTVSISGGQVTASGSSIYGVGIGGGNTGAAGEEVVVNITGGAVDASGRAGIGTANASNAKLTINISGGKVTARGAIDSSNKCAAIGQGNNSNSVTEINITGGIVRALGTGTGIGSGANSKQTPTIKLGYTDETKNGMEITAIDYNGTVTLNKSFKYQDGTEAVSTPITANKTIVPSDSTAHTHGFTYTVEGKTITATCANSDNQCNLTEHKATLTIGEPDGKTSMVYDGTAKAAVLTGDTDVLTADVVYKKGNTVLPSAPSDAGNYTASITLGEATATVSYEITKKSVTFASITAKDKVYDGTTKASCTIGTGVNGAISGDSVSANVSSGVANFDTPDVGVNKAVTFTNWTLQGSSKDNYEMVQPEPQYRTITPRVITITAKAQTVPQGGTVVSTPDQVEITSGTLVSGHSISEVTLTGDTSAITDSGTVTSSAIKILDSSNVDVTANYLVNYVAGKLTVTEAPAHTHSFIYTGFGATITATCGAASCPLTNSQATLTIAAPTSLTYDGTAKAATITGDTAVLGTPGIVYKQGDTVLTAAPVNAGTYTANITLGTGENAATASVSYTIAPKSVTITGLSVSNKEYDGTPTATATGGTIDGKVGNDDVSFTAGTAAFADANVGTGKTVTFSGYSLTGTAAGNYTLSAQPASVTADITAKDEPAGWESLQALLSGDAKTVTLTQDYTATADNSCLKVPEGRTVTLDLNGHRIDGSALMDGSTLHDWGRLTLTDSKGGGELIGSSEGALLVDDDSECTMTGGAITAKNAAHGAVSVGSGAVFTVSGGAITAENAGYGAVYVYVDEDEDSRSSVFTVSGAPEISSVYLGSGAVITIGGALTWTTPLPVKTEDTPVDDAPVTITSGLAEHAGTAEQFTSADMIYDVVLNDSGEAELRPSQTAGTDGKIIVGNNDPVTLGKTYAFIPEDDGAYVFYSVGEIDTVGELYLNDKLIADDDNSGEGHNFRISEFLNARSRCKLCVHAYNNGENGGTCTVVVEHNRAAQTISFASATQAKTYGDADFTVTATGAKTNVSYQVTGGDAATVGSATGAVHIVKAGTATITATAEETSAYTSATASYTLTVNPKSVAIPTAASGLKWTGSEQTGVASGEGYTVTNGAATAVGNYTATATLDNTANYKWSDNTTAAKSIAWSIGKANSPAAPTGLTGVAPTSGSGSDGRIIGVTTDMEYSADATAYTPCSGTEITGLTAGTYYVRYQETATHEAGTAATVSVPAYNPPAPATVAAPTFDPPAGTYSAAQNVTITCSTNGATIHYTTNGSTPTASSPTYSAPISVSATATIKAIAVKSGMTNSKISAAAYKISITPATYAATVNNGTGDGNYAPGTTVTITADAPASGKVFDKWISSDGLTFAMETSATTTFVMPAKDVTVTATYKSKPAPTPGGDPSPSPTPDTKITIPVSGDDETVNITVTIKGETATITSANIDKVLNAEDVGTVIIDASTLKQDVTAVVIPGAMVEKIADAVADEENDADGIEIKLPTGTVAFDAEAVAAISEQANGKDLRLNLENIGENKLNTAQKSAVEDMDVQEVLDVYMTADGKRISNFQGGKATVTVSYTLKDGQTGRGVVVWYVAEDGEKTEVSTTYNDKSVKFTVGHFSNYVIAYDAERAAACPKDDTCPMSSFTDLDLTQWYHDGIHFCLENGLMVGVGDNRFGTNGTTSRAMIVTILYRLEGKPEVTSENPFSDVKADRWYTDAVIWAAENEIVSGYGGGKFGPNDNITREQLATILYRYAQVKGTAVSPDQNIMDYEDVFDVSPWASGGLRWAVQLGIVQGVGNNKLAPKGDATRAQAATMIQRFCENLEKERGSG